jgi:small subunit ribosomal protein S21
LTTLATSLAFCWLSLVLFSSLITDFFLLFYILARSFTTELPVKIKIEVGDGEPIESALRRFKREINKSGHLMELRHKRYFENSQQKVKRKVKEGRLRKKYERMQKRRIQQRA